MRREGAHPVRHARALVRAGTRLGVIALVAAAIACERIPTEPPGDRRAGLAAAAADETIIEIKFVEELRIRWVAGEMRSLALGLPIAELTAALDRLQVEEVRPLFERSPEAVDLLAEAARARGHSPPDLGSWHRLHLEPDADVDAALAELLASPHVAHAYRAPEPAPPPGFFVPVPATVMPAASSTPDFTGMQGYSGAAPGGTNAVWARSQPGGSGQGILVIDLEYDWHFEHEDLQLTPAILITGDRYDAFGSHHGTAVLGQLSAIDNDYGVTGGVPDATVQVASPIYGGSYIPANAIAAAAAAMQPGDVLLLEQQTWGPNNEFVPLEWVQSVFDATRVATLAGRVVVAAAGNGGENLDAPEMLGRFDRDVRDSGAIIVGAGSTARARLSFSCYGSRVDVQGWGHNVTTTGYGTLFGTSFDDFYTGTFSGTSSASPIVTAAAVAVNGSLLAAGRPLLDSWEMAELLRSTGSPQTGNTAQNIGPLPDLVAALDFLESPPSPLDLLVEVVSGTHIDLGWPSVPGADAYRIGRRAWENGGWGAVDILGTTTESSHTDTDVQAGGRYRYRVQSCLGGTCSAWTHAPPTATPLDAPTELSAAAVSGTQADLTWPAVPGAETYRLARRMREAEGWGAVEFLSPTSGTSYNDTDLSPGARYRHRVQACGAWGCSDWTLAPLVDTPIDAPTAVDANLTSGTQIDLTWPAVPGAETYWIARRVRQDGVWGPIEPLGVLSDTSLSDTDLQSGARYRHRVRACGSWGCSEWMLGPPVDVPD